MLLSSGPILNGTAGTLPAKSKWNSRPNPHGVNKLCKVAPNRRMLIFLVPPCATIVAPTVLLLWIVSPSKTDLQRVIFYQPVVKHSNGKFPKMEVLMGKSYHIYQSWFSPGWTTRLGTHWSTTPHPLIPISSGFVLPPAPIYPQRINRTCPEARSSKWIYINLWAVFFESHSEIKQNNFCKKKWWETWEIKVPNMACLNCARFQEGHVPWPWLPSKELFTCRVSRSLRSAGAVPVVTYMWAPRGKHLHTYGKPRGKPWGIVSTHGGFSTSMPPCLFTEDM